MNKKLTKLLAVFVIAGAVGVGIAGAVTLSGCSGNNETQQTETTEYKATFEMNGHGSTMRKATTKNGVLAEPTAPTENGYYFDGWYTDEALTTKFDFSTTLTSDITLYAKWFEVVNISTADEFLSFRTQTGDDGSGSVQGMYTLTADIDLSGKTLGAATTILTGGSVFNGNGHVISNATYSEAAAKTGILCAQIDDATVTDVKFRACSVSSANESAAILAGLCNGGTISKIEFNSCLVTTTGNYAGLIYARNTSAAKINISEITAKNGCTTSCAQYGGFLTGDMVVGTTVNFKDIDAAGEFKGSSGNGSFVAGRTRGGIVTVENAILDVTAPSKPTSIGIFSGNAVLDKLVIKNVLITSSNISALYQSTKAPKEEEITNLVTVEGVTVDKATGTNGTRTETYLKDTLGFDFTADTGVWLSEGTGENVKYRLRAASTNVRREGSTVVKLSVSVGGATTRFHKGDTFSSAGITVMIEDSDGVQVVLGTDEYNVITSAVDMSKSNVTTGYTVTIQSKENTSITDTYKITVAEQTNFVIYDEFMAKTYLAGKRTTLDTANLVVKSVWNDSVEEAMEDTEYTIDASSYSMTAAGTYNVKVSCSGYSDQTIGITVLGATADPLSGDYYVTVDSGLTEVTPNAFTNVKDAIDFLEACDLPAAAKKVITIAPGTYKAKITTSLENLVLVGTGDKNTDTVLTYSAVESTENIVSGGTYGLNCATLDVSGSGFVAKNLSIRNDFDYINDSSKESSPQGLALTIRGDQSILDNVYLYGNQDTVYFKSGRTYIKGGEIDGNIDFIFGEATGLVYFEGVTVKAITKFADSVEDSKKTNNGYVTAMKATESDKPDYGYIFSGCTFTADDKVIDGSMSLGRPWGAKATVAYINCSFSAAYSTAAYDGKTKSRWFDMSGNKPSDADFCEYGSTGEGAITKAVEGGKVLTEAEAAEYTKTNIFAKTNGNCTWDEAWDCDAAYSAINTLYTKYTNAAASTPSVATYTVMLKNGDTTLGTAKYMSGDTPTEDEIKLCLSLPTGKSYDGLYTDSALTTAYTAAAVTADTTIYVKLKDDPTVTYEYYYGEKNAAEWAATTESTSTSDDNVTGLNLANEKGTSATLTLTCRSSIKVTITVKGFTRGSSKAQNYLTINLKNGDTIVKTITGTTTAGKVDGAYTLDVEMPYTAESAFTSIEFSCNTSDKNTAITSVVVVVE